MNIEIKEIPSWEVRKRYDEVLYPNMFVNYMPNPDDKTEYVLDITTYIVIERNQIKYIIPYRLKTILKKVRDYCNLLIATHKEIDNIKENYIIFDAEDINPKQATGELYSIVIYKIV